eukprot:TRINITY_DN29497_c0_g1_i1.p1 TRINITY_DN29497_c0_g1~~TRINITY_DN29497_c0_g1_i1.p1  ORF type:complete len:446 (+),score=145.57 TRINITY_DN29497_c0_g1_i1:37-1374(+)
MLSRNLLSKFGQKHIRRSLVQCAVSYDTESSEVVLNATKSRKSDDDKNERTSNRLFSVLSGALLGSAIVSQAENESEESDTKKSSRNSFPSLASLLPTLSAAEPVAPDQADKSPPLPPTKPPSRRSRFNFIADLVEETAPGLVYIEIKDTGVRDYFTGQPVTSSNGSGFIVGEDGLILTNAHVVINKPRANILVRLQDGRVFAGTIEDVDVKSDLATLRIPCKNLPQMKLGSSSDVRPGEWVVAMGSPLALSNTITTGVISNIARPHDELGLQGRDVPDYIQTDAAITFGNSGGPLINLDGEAIGINSMKVTPGISFAIPIDYAKEFLKKSAEAQKKGGGVDHSRRYIGITMVTLNPQIVEELKTRIQVPQNISHGIIIYRIVLGSPADTAGLKPGDIVTHINGKPIHGSRDVYKLLEGREDLNLTVIRDQNKFYQITVQPESTR